MRVISIKINTSQMLVNFTCISIIDLQETYIVKLVLEKYNIKNYCWLPVSLWPSFILKLYSRPVTGEEFRVNEFVQTTSNLTFSSGIIERDEQ